MEGRGVVERAAAREGRRAAWAGYSVIGSDGAVAERRRDGGNIIYRGGRSLGSEKNLSSFRVGDVIFDF